MTRAATSPNAAIVTDSETWHRHKRTSRPGDWLIIVAGTIRHDSGLCWIRNDTINPTFDGPYETNHKPTRHGTRVWHLGPRYQPTGLTR